MRQVVTKDVIVDGLLELGVQPGMRVMVHSSLKSFGRVEGGPVTVIEAVQEVVTTSGTIMMPSFNHGAPFGDGRAGYYDAGETPTTNGTIPDQFWRLPNMFRSLQPTHAFAAWGADARRYVENHHRTLTTGSESPLGLLHADGGFGLFLGVGFKANTFHHVVETLVQAPCLGYRTESFPIRLQDGTIVEGRTWGWRAQSCPITDGVRYEDLMMRDGNVRRAAVGESQSLLFKLEDCFRVVSSALAEGVGEYPPCSGCSIRPRDTANTVESDWDEQEQKLLESSAAWSYEFEV